MAVGLVVPEFFVLFAGMALMESTRPLSGRFGVKTRPINWPFLVAMVLVAAVLVASAN
jgi:hypothetical protein